MGITTKKLKAAIYNPYLNTLGGGERYSLSVAKILAENGYQVDVEWKDSLIKSKLEKRFGLKSGGVEFIPDIKRGDGYDLCFWVSDGSIPTLRARKNLLHFQIPFRGVGGKSLLNKMKLFRIANVVCNSYFTKGIIDSEYGVESVVVYPPVDTISIKPKRKENLIIFVGRFSGLKQSKGQDILIKAFKKFFDSVGGNWKLILAGGIEVGVGDEIKKITRSIGNYPIEIIKSPGFSNLKDLYGKAKFFWSGAGFGVNEEREPARVEHFGMSVVEAMTAGVVPLVYNAGGHKEIIVDGENGFLWTEVSELIKKTKKLISTPKTIKNISRKAIIDSQKFSYERFEKEFLALL